MGHFDPFPVFRSAALALVVSTCNLHGQGGLPPGPGTDLINSKCQGCHSLEAITNSAGISRKMWVSVMEEMKSLGVELSANEYKLIITYLATYLGSDAPPVKGSDQNSAYAERPSGSQLYDRHCGACHQKAGQGLPQKVPPLAGNLNLFQDRLYPLRVLLKGLRGPITVGGQLYDEVMPSFSHLSDSEVQAITNHILKAWNNRDLLPQSFKPLSREAVQRLRATVSTPEQVRGFRP